MNGVLIDIEQYSAMQVLTLTSCPHRIHVYLGATAINVCHELIQKYCCLLFFWVVWLTEMLWEYPWHFYFLLLPYPLSVLNIVHIAIAIDIYRVSCFIVLYSPWISNLNRPKIYLVWRFLFSFPMIGINQFFPPLWKFWNKAMCNDAVRQFQEFSFIRLYTTVNDCHDL